MANFTDYYSPALLMHSKYENQEYSNPTEKLKETASRLTFYVTCLDLLV